MGKWVNIDNVLYDCYYYCYYYYYHRLLVKGIAQKIECTCAIDAYVAKSKMPIELNISPRNDRG